MVVGNQDTGGTNSVTHPSGIPQDKIDNIMSGIANTGDVKMNNHRKKLRQRQVLRFECNVERKQTTTLSVPYL